MTVSEPSSPSPIKPLVDQALDLFVYAPVGLLTSSLEDLTADDLPELAEKGRGRIGRLLTNARVVGHLTVMMGRRAIAAEVARWRSPEPPEEPTTEREASVTEAAGAAAGSGPSPRTDAEADLAIPDYGALSASQVVRRLDGLGHSELLAIYEHESATRGRRTILHRANQLLGREDAPGPPGEPA